MLTTGIFLRTLEGQVNQYSSSYSSKDGGDSLGLEERDGGTGKEEDTGTSETPQREVGHEPANEGRGEAEDGTAGLEDLNTGPAGVRRKGQRACRTVASSCPGSRGGDEAGGDGDGGSPQ